MKSSLILLFLLAIVSTGYAQTNLWQSSGNVGIGTTSPTSQLHIYSADEPQMRLQSSGRQWALLTNPYWAKNGLSIYDVTADCSRITISPLGKVGINTIDPTWTLQVAGNIYGSYEVLDGDSGWGNGARLQLYGQTGPIGLQFKREVANPANWFWFIPANNADFTLNNGSDRLYISGNGNVGIGTSTPDSKLVVDCGGNNNIALRDDSLENHKAEGDTAGICINYVGFNGGTEYYRDFSIFNGKNGQLVRIQGSNGNVGIGTTSPSEKLSVNGRIRAKEVIVETTGWSDHVFADSYQLQSLADIEQHIKTEKHLPGVPSAQEVAEKGVSIGDMQATLLAKIEELTLHVIQQEKRITAQDAKLETQAEKISALDAENNRLKAAIK